MTAQPATLPIAFDHECRSAEDFARRYRVLASMSEGGVRFTMKPQELRAMADLFDHIAKRPDLLVAVIEKEKPLPTPIAMLMAFGIGAQIVMIGEIAARILWGAA